MKKSYLDYTVEDLAQADDFIRWVRGADEKLDVVWQEWILEHPDQQGKINKAKEILAAIETMSSPPSNALKDAIWEKIDRATLSDTQVIEMTKPRHLTWRKIAASIILPLSLGLVIYLSTKSSSNTAIATTVGEIMEHQLPDGSTVHLNSVSQLSYNTKTWETNRDISLEGEAFFDVEKGSKFTVNTPMGQIEVLGTSFNIIARDSDFKVACYTGRVRVSVSEDDIVDLEPYQGSFTQNEKLYLKPLKNDHDLAYIQDIHHFDNDPLSDVFAELERQYDVKIMLPDELKNRSYSGFFIGQNLNEAIHSICWPMRLEWEIDGKNVLINSPSE